VVFESGIAASSLSWARVQPEVARFTRACAYDRAGLAWSESPSAPRTIDRIVDDLGALLRALEIPAPYVLVGHSFGAFVCLAFAGLHSADVNGLVLVDPPTEWTTLTPHRRRLLRGGARLSRVGGVLARVGIVRASLALLTGGAPSAPRHFVKVFGPTAARTLERLVGEVRKLPAEVHPIVQALWCQPKCFASMAEHLAALEGAAAAASRVGTLGEIPLCVISAGDQPPEVLAAHRALASLSTRGRHLVAENSGHWVQFDDPALVVEAIRSVV
jgi:pimeloyl-ACP methyl ester carboxylesterase